MLCYPLPRFASYHPASCPCLLVPCAPLASQLMPICIIYVGLHSNPLHLPSRALLGPHAAAASWRGIQYKSLPLGAGTLSSLRYPLSSLRYPLSSLVTLLPLARSFNRPLSSGIVDSACTNPFPYQQPQPPSLLLVVNARASLTPSLLSPYVSSQPLCRCVPLDAHPPRLQPATPPADPSLRCTISWPTHLSRCRPRPASGSWRQTSRMRHPLLIAAAVTAAAATATATALLPPMRGGALPHQIFRPLVPIAYICFNVLQCIGPLV
ncbi:hypothetical protein DFH09DRAFT_1414189 [Mycena vulgaris]|nr:hypothetical protein DFH09DRAFT_1414189 [Mycena vulgaris]